MCGTVVKEIAEKIYSNCTVFDMKKVSTDSLKTPYPNVLNGDYAALKNVTKKLNIKTNESDIKSTYVTSSSDGRGVSLKDLPIVENLTPNVIGMGAKDAIFALENCGLRVSVSGFGSVVSQSIATGSRVSPGQTVTLTLR